MAVRANITLLGASDGNPARDVASSTEATADITATTAAPAAQALDSTDVGLLDLPAGVLQAIFLDVKEQLAPSTSALFVRDRCTNIAATSKTMLGALLCTPGVRLTLRVESPPASHSWWREVIRGADKLHLCFIWKTCAQTAATVLELLCPPGPTCCTYPGVTSLTLKVSATHHGYSACSGAYPDCC
mmetsp:Transcript_13241/g.23315  ORF Transcript_13241/g.23315 Transcript_13241/m.23315 type:complete len:187 (-) Transcript_13241:413-973(-)